MLLGDGFVAIGLLVLAGIVGFFVMAVAIVARIGGAVLRALFGSSSGRVAAAGRRLGQDAAACPHPRCGHANQRGARFCARCGRSLRTNGVDAYG